MARRLQGDVRAAARAPARLIVAAVFALLAVVPAATSVDDLVSRLRDEHRQFKGLTEEQRLNALWRYNGMPRSPQIFQFFRENLLPGERFTFQFPKPEPWFRRAFEIYGRWHLYPNEYVSRAEEADVVLAYGAEPEDLGLGFRTQRRHPTGASIAWRPRGG